MKKKERRRRKEGEEEDEKGDEPPLDVFARFATAQMDANKVMAAILLAVFLACLEPRFLRRV